MCFMTMLVLNIMGCSMFKAKPAPPSGFLQNEEASDNMVKLERYPFHRAWLSNDWKENRYQYKNIIVAPINTSHLMEMEWFKAQIFKTKQMIKKDSVEIARYFEDKLKDAIVTKEKHPFSIVTSPQAKTIRLEIAIVELVPSKAWWNATASAAGFVIPGAGFLTTLGKGEIAIEARITDAQSGKTLALFADREADKSAPINIAQYTWYQHTKNNIDDWVDQFAELHDTPFDQVVTDSKPFMLKPW